MTTPEVAKDLFTEAQAAFTPVVGAPNDDDVDGMQGVDKRLVEKLDIVVVRRADNGGEG